MKISILLSAMFLVFIGCSYQPTIKSPKLIPQTILQETNNASQNTANTLLYLPSQKASTKQKPAFIHNGVINPMGSDPRDFISIMSFVGGVITLRESAFGSAIWTLSPVYYPYFSDAYNWRMEALPDGHFRFINKLTQTCMHIHTKELIHQPCEHKNPNQVFKLTPMSNGAFQIQNVNTQQCLETSLSPNRDYPIKIRKCLKIENLEQQWVLAPPFLKPTPVVYP